MNIMVNKRYALSSFLGILRECPSRKVENSLQLHVTHMGFNSCTDRALFGLLGPGAGGLLRPSHWVESLNEAQDRMMCWACFCVCIMY